jgi:hypothetical protein
MNKRDEVVMTASLDLDQPLRLHPLTFLPEGEEVTVGRPDINSYGMFPAEGAELIKMLADGQSPNAVSQWYAEKFGETLDMGEFLELLDEFEMLVKEGEQAAVVPTGPVRWQRLGQALFSPVAWAVYGLLVVAAVVAIIRTPAMMPTYHDMFFTNSLVILTLTLFIGQMPWILLHESFHALAGRRLGLSSTLSISRRLYFLVFETSLDGLVAVPRRKRYLPMLAGMVMDVLVISVLILVAAFLQNNSVQHLIGQILLAMAFATILRLTWQFYFFLRTDLYYLAITVLGCVNLQVVAKQMMRNRFNRMLGRTDKLIDEETWHPRDRQVGAWYSWLMVVGYVVALGLLAWQIAPALIQIVKIAITKITVAHSLLNVGDVVLFIILNFGELIIAGALAVYGYRRRARVAAALALADNGVTR